VEFFASPQIDRIAHRRTDAAWLAERLVDEATGFVPVWRGRSLVAWGQEARAVAWDARQVAACAPRVPPVLLGQEVSGRVWFALGLEPEWSPGDHLSGEENRFVDLRRIALRLSAPDAGLLAYARAMVHWHETHCFCGACGTATRTTEAGWLRTCENPACGRQHFPRTDPAVIMRITQDDRVLLARQASWPERWYSVLAGFVEPGERLQDAVRREVAEEVGLQLHEVRYAGSQPWPFPASLMLGFTARARDATICLDGEELEDARWFTREQIRQGVRDETLRLSPRSSISRWLLDAWLGTPDRPAAGNC